MTKKRFIKLMMANGYSRNEANKIAASVAGTGRSYLGTWNIHKIKIDFVCNTEQFAIAIKRIEKMILDGWGKFAPIARGILQSLNSTN